MSSLSFPKTERLLNRKDFVNLNRTGKRYRTDHFTIIIQKNGLGITRLGITASKKIGNSVKRNRVKRRIKEVYRLNKNQFPDQYDIVIIPKRQAVELEFSQIQEELCGIWLDQKGRV
jgi:ribonuclease P protein component